MCIWEDGDVDYGWVSTQGRMAGGEDAYGLVKVVCRDLYLLSLDPFDVIVVREILFSVARLLYLRSFRKLKS